MLSSKSRILASILFLGIASLARAQNDPTKDQTASISGKVTLKKKALADVVVFAVDYNDNDELQHPWRRAITDEAGNYRITNLPAGNYYVYPLAPAFVGDNGSGKQQIVLAPGENIRDMDFALIPGGVITGRITNADGQPLIEEVVNVTPLDPQSEFSSPEFAVVRTDDRGIYRAFGLRRGKYKVSVGRTERVLPGQMRRIYRQTFYPSVIEPDKATILDVSEGSEIRNVDIVMGPPVTTFKATGRIIESETGKPVPDVVFGVGRIDGTTSISSMGATGSDKHGEFRVENLIPGKYTIFPYSETSDWRAESLTIEVVDRDLTGLEIKTTRGASVSGMVIVKNSEDKAGAPRFDRFNVFAFVQGPPNEYGGSRTAPLRPDGSFKIVGLAPGNVALDIVALDPTESRQFKVVSIEHNGVSLSGGIDVKAADDIDGIRIFVKNVSFTGTIRGQIKFENGEPPPTAKIAVSVGLINESRGPLDNLLPSPAVDSRGRFLLENLAGGTYEVIVTLYEPSEPAKAETTRQQVTVASGTVSDVTIPIKLKP